MTKIKYQIEAKAQTVCWRVVCGSTKGYTGQRERSLSSVIDIIEGLHYKIIDEEKKTPLPCIISEGYLIGRTGKSAYREKVYFCDFSLSPRAEPIRVQEFGKRVRWYAFKLGEALNQTRMYIELNGKTEVWKVDN